MKPRRRSGARAISRLTRLLVTTAITVLAVGWIIGNVSYATGSSGRQEYKRTAAGTYQTPEPSLIPVHPYGVHLCNRGGALGESRGCVEFGVRPMERFVNVVVEDASGLSVPAYIQIGDDNSDKWIPFCGTTEAPVKIKPGVEIAIRVFAYRSVNLPTCVGTATQGVVNVTFSKSLPKP